MTSLGNHERDWVGSGYMEGDDSGGECGVPSERRFLMPTPQQDMPWCALSFVVLTCMETLVLECSGLGAINETALKSVRGPTPVFSSLCVCVCVC